MKKEQQKYRKHIFVCINERPEGDCCSKAGGINVVQKLKEALQKKGIKDVRINKSGCMNCCNPVGATVVMYPEGKWFLEVKEEDVEEILNQI